MRWHVILRFLILVTHVNLFGVGFISEWGAHVNPWLIHVNVWQKPLQYCKVISLQLIKINGKKKNKKTKAEHSPSLWFPDRVQIPVQVPPAAGKEEPEVEKSDPGWFQASGRLDGLLSW